MKIRLILCGVPLVMMMSTQLIAQVTPGPGTEFMPMLAQVTQIPNGSPVVLVQSPSFPLQAGEMRRVFGRAEITSTAVPNTPWDVEANIICFGPNGWTSQIAGASQNYQGPNTPAGPSYPTTGHIVFYPLLLLQAPYAGNYSCHLWATSEDGPTMAVGRSFQGDNTTWLRVSAANEVGAQWWQDRTCDEWGNVGGNAGPSRTLPGTDNNGTINNYPASWCNYLGGPSGRPEIFVFFNDESYSTLPPQWEAASNAAFVDARDSLMVTTCYQSNSCTPAERGQPDLGSGVDSYLELIQLNAAGGSCNVTQSPDQVSNATSSAHHYMIYHELLAVPVLPSCGSRKFLLMIFVKWISGNPFKIDGSQYTHAFAINSFFGTAPPVPNVVGLAESAASNTLSASGYYVSLVSNGYATAPPGSVTAQYPAAGTIEFPGSGVNLTLSTGSVTVPKVTTLKETTAAQNISAVGLVPKEILQPGCKDPGIVQSQNPEAGSGVAPGSTVSLTVNSGKTTNGAACSPE